MSSEKQKELFRHAYSQIAMADGDMREAAAILEGIRECMNGGSTYHDVLGTVDEQIGQADLIRIVPALEGFRKTYTQSVVDNEVERIKQAFERDAASGWHAWVNAYVQNLQETAWRTDINRQLSARALMSAPNGQWTIERIRRCDWFIHRERWPEAYDWLLFLAEQQIPPVFRARMIAIAAEIQLFRFAQRTECERLLDRAESVFADEFVTNRARAEFSFEIKDIAKAKQLYQAIAEKRPRIADGFVGQAECADAEGDTVAAEAFYQQAVRAAPGMTLSHRSLMNWYGKQLGQRESLVLSIFKRLHVVADEDPGDFVGLALLYKNAGKLNEARAHLRTCISLQPDNGLAEAWAGHVDRDEAGIDQSRRETLLESAEAHFRKDLAICPEGMDAPWGMMCVAMDRKNWTEATTWCNTCLALHPEWESSFLERRAAIEMELTDWAGAERDLRRSIAREPQNIPAADALLDLADKIASTDAGKTKAEEILTTWRHLKGDSEEYVYQNRLGNWDYNVGDYAAAVQHYELAVAANPSRPVLLSNYALAAAALRTQADRRTWLDRAISKLSIAAKLDCEELDYRERLARLTTERDFIDVYGEKALELKTTVIPLGVEIQDADIGVILNSERNDLSKETIDRINAWRTAFRSRMGLTLPGVNVTIASGLVEPGLFRMTIMEQHEGVGSTRGMDLLEAVFKELEAFCSAHLDEFMGHQEAAGLLRNIQHPAAGDIIATPRSLTKYVGVLKARLEQGASIADLQSITDVFAASIPSAETVTTDVKS